ncbi:SDR family NAD(P)-dependent oxidoreductase [Azospirillum doebereinerae]|uniref:SDR family NAD(P)-dependent oxidoreductase n=1 Tax=Azospirillum doebereinerae TaxID=92933 RepID=A0A433J4Z6_9PROT|nr:SDR family NAD(P)-dependent oxidoreductase [Azospirillum doebereinerae]RUQ67527.1 SDR family NAD(P)-dependent oxidoreductase [Azospirillum doebereinerae]
MRHPRSIPRSIVITGASSGIGEALAMSYAAPGVTLALTGRDAARLEAVAGRCRAAGATVTTGLLDAADRTAMAAWLAAAESAAPVDLVVANAGMSAGTGGGVESEEQARRILSVNLDGVLNTIHPLLPAMRARGRGQIALMASQASFRGLPGAPAYCASKAAVRVYGEALRGDLAGEGIGVSVICPGFVKSRMTAVNRFPMPFLMETEAAAWAIKRGLARNAARIGFPWPMVAAVWLLALLPPGWTDAALIKAPKKG